MSKSTASDGTTGATRTRTRFVDGNDHDGSNVRGAIQAVEAHPELDPAILGDLVTFNAVNHYWSARGRLEEARKARDEVNKLIDATIPGDETRRVSRVNYIVALRWDRWVEVAWHEFNDAERNLIRSVYLWARGIEVPAGMDDDFEWTPTSVRFDGTLYAVVPDDEDRPNDNPRLVVINPQDFADVDPGEPDED